MLNTYNQADPKREQLSDLTTRHCNFKKHLHNLKLYIQDQVCTLCNKEEGIASHIRFECPALESCRKVMIGPYCLKSTPTRSSSSESSLNSLSLQNCQNQQSCGYQYNKPPGCSDRAIKLSKLVLGNKVSIIQFLSSCGPTDFSCGVLLVPPTLTSSAVLHHHDITCGKYNG